MTASEDHLDWREECIDFGEGILSIGLSGQLLWLDNAFEFELVNGQSASFVKG